VYKRKNITYTIVKFVYPVSFHVVLMRLIKLVLFMFNFNNYFQIFPGRRKLKHLFGSVSITIIIHRRLGITIARESRVD